MWMTGRQVMLRLGNFYNLLAEGSMYKSNFASQLLNGDYWVTTEPYCYTEDRIGLGFSLYVPPGYLVELPLLPVPLRWLLPERFKESIIMYLYLKETKAPFYKKKPFAIEDKHVDIVFLDMLKQRQYPKIITPLLKVLLFLQGQKKRFSPTYLLRKNAVEFYLRERVKLDGYCA